MNFLLTFFLLISLLQLQLIHIKLWHLPAQLCAESKQNNTKLLIRGNNVEVNLLLSLWQIAALAQT